MTVKRLELHYKPEPTARRFHGSAARVRNLMGPVGGGKSSICCWEVLLRSKNQQPGQDGVRRTRWAIIRQTYPELRSTTIKTFLDWFPEPLTSIVYGAPITAELAFPLEEDGTRVQAEVLFLALERPADVKKLLSLELTGAWINEWREVPIEVLHMLTARIGRYPSKEMGGPTWTGIFGDTNPPDDDHPLYHLFEVEKPADYALFKQPPALVQVGANYVANIGQVPGIPAAENINHLAEGFNYYLSQLSGKDPNWIKVYVLGNYGHTRSGKPVWPEYNDALHFSEQLVEPMRGIPLIIGMDFGLTPAAVLCQLTPHGQIILLDEACSTSMGIRQFVTDVLKPKLQNEYNGIRVRIKGDPAGRSRAQTDEKTCYDILAELGMMAAPSRTNDFLPRREAVAKFLLRHGGFAIGPKCKMLRKALNGEYQYERVQVTGPERYKDQPAKNMYSHIADALQYACMDADYTATDAVELSIPMDVVDHSTWGAT